MGCAVRAKPANLRGSFRVVVLLISNCWFAQVTAGEDGSLCMFDFNRDKRDPTKVSIRLIAFLALALLTCFARMNR